MDGDDKTKVVTVRLPELDVEIIDEFVKAGLFASRSDFVRFAVYKFLFDWYLGLGIDDVDEKEIMEVIREIDEEVGDMEVDKASRRVLYMRKD